MLDKLARQRFVAKWKPYLIASGMCSVTLFMTLLVLSSQNLVIVASIGASAFIVFAMPRSRAAQTAATIGGHLIGLLCGGLASFIPHHTPVANAAVYAVAVGMCCFLMLTTRYRHPPAAGTSLGIAVSGINAGAVSTVFIGAVIISFIRIMVLSVLTDFTMEK